MKRHKHRIDESTEMISVIICTFNRGRVFEDTVRSFFECHADGIEYELLLVDNKSTDNTREFIERIAQQNKKIRYLYEPRQGLSHARNRGIRESRGDIVAFVDDDVYLSPLWLRNLRSSFDRHAEASCLGGKVIPHFETERPAWLDDDLLWIYGVTRYGENEREIQPPDIPIGCNMAFRCSVFEKIGDFQTSLGRKGRSLLSGEENHFFQRTAQADLKTIYSPDVQVFHRIPPDRLTRQWIMRRFYWAGISDVAMRQVGDDPLSRVILTKKAIRRVYDLLRQWKSLAKCLDAGRGAYSSDPIGRQKAIFYKMGELRQMILEMFSVPNREVVHKGFRVTNK